ncbi:unnamed protein product [Prorocentrum cordatum]|uniref:Major facilitator superfamily (MFS) profile domain-containing protein n=1 Tax=Prorocentrum cordatum TaxID=2364126 RepID=A0ABN9V3J6_9DINO|nr:unnamed protein product [Polarella glacialis]
MANFELPQVAINFFDNSACGADPKGEACRRAQSQASLAISVSSGVASLVCLLCGPSFGVLSDAWGRRFYTVGSVAIALVAMLALLAHVFGLVSLCPLGRRILG